MRSPYDQRAPDYDDWWLGTPAPGLLVIDSAWRPDVPAERMDQRTLTRWVAP